MTRQAKRPALSGCRDSGAGSGWFRFRANSEIAAS